MISTLLKIRIKDINKEANEESLEKEAIKDDKAFEKLIEHYKEYLYKTAYLYVKNGADALDIVGETIYKSFIGRKKFKDYSFFKTWITRILINNAIDLLKKKKKLSSVDNNDLFVEGKSIEDVINYIDLYDAIDLLNIKYKNAIIMRYFNGMTIEEVAKVMELPEGTVKTYLHRGKQCLARLLKEEE